MQEYQYIWKGEKDDHEASNKQTLINEGHHHEISEDKAKEKLNKILEISSIIQDVNIYLSFKLILYRELSLSWNRSIFGLLDS